MSLLSLSSAAGPSATTLAALSEYCSSSDSPNSDPFPQSQSSDSFNSDVVPFASPNPVPELADVIVQSSRFQSASVQEKMLKALRASTSSGFTREAPSKSRKNRAISTQAIYEGFPPSPSDCFFNDASLVEVSTPAHIGLGILFPSSSSNDSHLASPLAARRTAPIPGLDGLPEDILASRLLLSPIAGPSRSPPATPPRYATAYVSAQNAASTAHTAASSSRYAGLGHGLPSHLNTSTTAHNSRTTSRSITLATVRRISQFVGVGIDLFASYPTAILPRVARRITAGHRFEGDSSTLTETAAAPAQRGPLGWLGVGAVNFLREHLPFGASSSIREATSTSPVFRADVAARGFRAAHDEGLVLKRALATVGRFLSRK
ncbi:hypothetical protein B0H16DRAFT_1720354 [Mycena metata]|uniref:Uncharacterized protein n=1 Tax=Mycena metata TaxID=1033252 RepID=A0AAD7NGS1_9AGAR|nr:hypothetical protein B0H16DRAFT_1720354 [Mycena metata]